VWELSLPTAHTLSLACAVKGAEEIADTVFSMLEGWEFFFQMSEIRDLGPHICQFSFKQRLNFWTDVFSLTKRKQLFDFNEREAEFLSVAHER